MDRFQGIGLIFSYWRKLERILESLSTAAASINAMQPGLRLVNSLFDSSKPNDTDFKGLVSRNRSKCTYLPAAEPIFSNSRVALSNGIKLLAESESLLMGKPGWSV